MNILWLANLPLPEASKLLYKNPLPFGGWLVNSSGALSEQDNIKLSVAFPLKDTNKIKILKGEKIDYYGFPPVNKKIIDYNRSNEYFQKILKRAKPDIVHIFGTEYPHTLSMVNTCNNEGIKAIISIQGLV